MEASMYSLSVRESILNVTSAGKNKPSTCITSLYVLSSENRSRQTMFFSLTSRMSLSGPMDEPFRNNLPLLIVIIATPARLLSRFSFLYIPLGAHVFYVGG